MDDDERKSRLHIHTGGLIILMIVLLFLFKVDIKSKIQSPQFQENYSYITEQVKTFWQKNILNPIKSKISDMFINTTNKRIKEIQDNFNKNVLKTDGIDNEIKKYEIE